MNAYFLTNIKQGTSQNNLRSLFNSIKRQTTEIPVAIICENNDAEIKKIETCIKETKIDGTLFVNNNNLYESQFKNIVIKSLETEIILITTAESVNYSDRAEKEITLLTSTDLSIIGSSVIFGTTEFTVPQYYIECYDMFFYKKEVFVHRETVAYKVKDFLEIGGYNKQPTTLIDFEVWCRFMTQGYKVMNVQKPLVNTNEVDFNAKEDVESIWKSFYFRQLPTLPLPKEYV